MTETNHFKDRVMEIKAGLDNGSLPYDMTVLTELVSFLTKLNTLATSITGEFVPEEFYDDACRCVACCNEAYLNHMSQLIEDDTENEFAKALIEEDFEQYDGPVKEEFEAEDMKEFRSDMVFTSEEQREVFNNLKAWGDACLAEAKKDDVEATEEDVSLYNEKVDAYNKVVEMENDLDEADVIEPGPKPLATVNYTNYLFENRRHFANVVYGLIGRGFVVYASKGVVPGTHDIMATRETL